MIKTMLGKGRGGARRSRRQGPLLGEGQGRLGATMGAAQRQSRTCLISTEVPLIACCRSYFGITLCEVQPVAKPSRPCISINYAFILHQPEAQQWLLRIPIKPCC